MKESKGIESSKELIQELKPQPQSSNFSWNRQIWAFWKCLLQILAFETAKDLKTLMNCSQWQKTSALFPSFSPLLAVLAPEELTGGWR